MKSQLEVSKGFDKIKADQDVVELLHLIRSICHRHDQNTNKLNLHSGYIIEDVVVLLSKN